jgi:nucleoside-diphosphate-sugar epimerase
MEIDKQAPVMVTGASGYIAGWIVKLLLDAGHTVHATVRNPERAESVQHLLRAAAEGPGKLVLFKADLLSQGSFDAAAQGCAGVIHTASPFIIGRIADPNAALVRPALEGTRNVLSSVERTPSVKRVVLTSSVASIYGDADELALAPGGVFTEAQWNTTSSLSHNPYPYSKVSAEKEALRIHQGQSRWDLVCINPGLVLGPSLTAHSDSYSIQLLRDMGRGKYRTGVPALHFGCVDVRDVAEAHVRALYTAGAAGRYIVSAGELSMLGIARLLRPKYGRYRLPSVELPKPLVWLLGPVSAGVTRKFVQKNVGMPVRFDTRRGQRELGLSYRPLGQTVNAQFEQLLSAGLVRART